MPARQQRMQIMELFQQLRIFNFPHWLRSLLAKPHFSTFWRFSAWIWAKVASISSKRHLHHRDLRHFFISFCFIDLPSTGLASTSKISDWRHHREEQFLPWSVVAGNFAESFSSNFWAFSCIFQSPLSRSLWSRYQWKDLFLLQNLNIDDANFRHSDDVRSGTKGNARHGRLRAAYAPSQWPFSHYWEDEQIVWTDKSSGICPSDVNLCRTVVDLFVSTGKSSWKWIVFPDGQISDELFVPFAHQTICSSETICPSIWFVRPLVWKRPMGLITNGLQPSRSSCTAMEFMQTAKD